MCLIIGVREQFPSNVIKTHELTVSLRNTTHDIALDPSY